MKQKTAAMFRAVLGAAFLAGCACIEAAGPAPAPRPVATGSYSTIATANGVTTVQTPMPTGEVTSSVVLLETKTPAEVYVGAAIDYEMKVTNLTDSALDEVVLTAQIPESFELSASAPRAQINAARQAKWELGQLPGRQSRSVRVRGVPTKGGPFVSCARVTYSPVCCIAFVAVEPKLALQKTMPSDVLVCDDIPIRLVVANTGTGTIQNVKVVDTLPDGWATADGRTQVAFDAGSLAAGQSRTMSLVAKATRTGTFTNKAVAFAGSFRAEDTAIVKVHRPVLGITKTGTKSQFSGRDVVYNIEVTNKGDAPATNLVVEDILPEGVTFAAASNGGVFAQGRVRWTAASLAPGATFAVGVTGRAVGHGRITNRATAMATCAEAVSAASTTDMIGKAAILLEVVDEADPLSVGDTETYTVTATNQGTAPDTNIKIVCTIEDNEVFLSAGGASVGTCVDGVVTFEPVASLAPKAKAVWQVKVKGVKEGDVRFAVQLTTDELKRPVKETEATQVY